MPEQTMTDSRQTRGQSVPKTLDLDDIRELWVERCHEAFADERKRTAAYYARVVAVLAYEARAADAAAELQAYGAFLLARAAELAGR